MAQTKTRRKFQLPSHFRVRGAPYSDLSIFQKIGVAGPSSTPVSDLRQLARDVVEEYKAGKRIIPGIGHPEHKEVDPRVPRLFEVAAANGLSSRHVELVRLIGDEASAALGRNLPVNATGAIGAIASELEIPWQVCRGLAVMARAIGLVAHLQEEVTDPLAPEIWSRVEGEASERTRDE